MRLREYRALAAFFSLGWRQAAAQRATTFGRVALLVLILFIFWALWNATPLGELGTQRLTVNQLFWYLAATEVVAMSVGFPYRIVENDIVSGEIATALVRPIPYAFATLANWIGEMTYSFIAICAVSATCGLIVTRQLPCDGGQAIALVIALWLGCVMLLISQFAIGLLATWMRSAAPAFWIWQKFFFILGGLMIPLSLYPMWLAAIAKATPFAAMLYWPASLLLTSSDFSIASLLFVQLGWIIVLITLALLLQSQAERRFIHRGI